MAFKMKGPTFYKGIGGMGAKGAIKNQKDYAGQADGRATSSPFQQKDEKPELNQWGETPEEYKTRMEEMGLRKPDEKTKESTKPLKQTVGGGIQPTKSTTSNITNAMSSAVGISPFPQSTYFGKTGKEITTAITKTGKNIKKGVKKIIKNSPSGRLIEKGKQLYKKYRSQ